MFPSFKAWLSAIRLTISALWCGTIIAPMFFWLALLVSIFMPLDIMPYVMAFALLCLVTGFVWHLIIRGLWWLLLKIFWSAPPRWLSPDTLRSGFYGYGVMLVASIPLVITFVTTFGFEVLINAVEERQVDLQPLHVEALVLMAWSFPALAAYLCHWCPLPSSTKCRLVQGIPQKR